MSDFKLGTANVTFAMRQSKNSYLAMTSAIIEPSDGGKIEVNTAEAFDKGVEQERERIIKLLHDRFDWLLDQNTLEKTAEAEVWLKAIALIKGQK